MGSLDIITGPMFSGKSTEALRRATIELEVGAAVLYIGHAADTRSAEAFSTHNKLYKTKAIEHPNMRFATARALSEVDVSAFDVVVIDEAQFFDDLSLVVEGWVEALGKRVIIAGLNSTFLRTPFGQIHALEPLCDSFVKLKSYCAECARSKKRTPALFSYRRDAASPAELAASPAEKRSLIDVGGREKYFPVCRACFLMLGGAKK